MVGLQAHADDASCLVTVTDSWCLIPSVLLHAAEKPPKLMDDTVDVQADAGANFNFKLDVLRELPRTAGSNDSPSGELRLVGVEALGPTTGGMMFVDPTNMFLYYQLNTMGMSPGLKFTDKFRCVCVCIGRDPYLQTCSTQVSSSSYGDVKGCRCCAGAGCWCNTFGNSTVAAPAAERDVSAQQ
jgi:hypothetical protein